MTSEAFEDPSSSKKSLYRFSGDLNAVADKLPLKK
jgi:hypothetical protein